VDFLVLGPLQVHNAGRAVAFGSSKQREALALLIVSAPGTVSTARLIDQLWGERPPSSAQHAIQVYISAIRKSLRSMGLDADLVVRKAPAGYELRTRPDQVDAGRFERLLADGQKALVENPSGARPILEEAVALWRGPAFADVQECESVRQEAMRLDELRVVAIESLVEARLAGGEGEQLIGVISGIVADYPLRERPLRQLMLALHRSGRQADALAAYRQRFRALDELGMRPGPELRELEQAILAHDDRLAAPRSVLVARAEHNLPVAPTSLVGRDDDVHAAVEILRQTDSRVLTVTGAPGIGKTRVALAAAERLLHDFEVVHLTPLAAVREPGLVAATLAVGLGAGRREEGHAIDALIDVLDRRTTLLVLDNFEHLMSAAQVVSEIVSRSRTTKVLVTSRAPLRLSAERTYPLRPLRTPDPGAVRDLEELLRAPASALFVQRAKDATPTFTVHAAEASTVAAICVHLDGLPLAIELAATHCRILRPDQLLTELDHRLDLLAGGAVDLPDRQQTVRATLDWSHQLLSPSERTLFAGLAVFVGGFTFAAARAVTDETGQSVLATLTALVDSGLVGVDDGGHERRFLMLETIREYARERFGALPDPELIRSRHARYYLATAEASLRTTPEVPAGVASLRRDLGNFRAALQFAHGRGDLTTLGRLIVSLERVVPFWGDTETRGWLEAAAGAKGLPTRTAAEVNVALAKLAVGRADAAEAERRARRSFEQFAEIGELAGVADSLRALAGAVRQGGDIAGSEALLRESLAAARQVDDPIRAAAALGNLAVVAYSSGDWQLVLERARDALHAAMDAGDLVLRGTALSMLGEAQFALGDRARGRSTLEEALTLLEAEGGGRFTMDTCIALAHVSVLDAPEEAEALLRRGAQIARNLEKWARLADMMIGLAEVRAAQSRHGEALRLLAAAGAACDEHPWLVDGRERELLHGLRAESERILGADETKRQLGARPGLRPHDILALLGAPLSGARNPEATGAFGPGELENPDRPAVGSGRERRSADG
jgi:predicted ATPase/DNA-binding SARP family transcriptional activator